MLSEPIRRRAQRGAGEGEGPAGGPLARTAQPRGAGGFPPVGRGVAPNQLYLSHIATIIARVRPPTEKGKARKMDISKLTHGAKLVLGATIAVPDRVVLQLVRRYGHRRSGEHVARLGVLAGLLAIAIIVWEAAPPRQHEGRARRCTPAMVTAALAVLAPVRVHPLHLQLPGDSARRRRPHVLGVARPAARDPDRRRCLGEHEEPASRYPRWATSRRASAAQQRGRGGEGSDGQGPTTLLPRAPAAAAPAPAAPAATCSCSCRLLAASRRPRGRDAPASRRAGGRAAHGHRGSDDESPPPTPA